MNKVSEHTPTPWKVVEYKGTGYCRIACDADISQLARVRGEDIFIPADQVDKANAKLIVEAVNNHSRLLKENEIMLKAIKLAIRWFKKQPVHIRPNVSEQDMIERLQQAIGE